MTRQLRQRHRQIFPLLGVVVGMLFVIGLVRRRPLPSVESLPAETTAQIFTATGEDRSDLFEKAPVHVRLWRLQQIGALAIDFTAARDFLKPDLLAYWSAQRPALADTLPPNATLLGNFRGGPLLLPLEASSKDGCLILFSLAHNEVVDISKPIRF